MSQRVEEREVYRGKWLTFNECDYKTTDPKTGEECVHKSYEFVKRTTRLENNNVDGAAIVPILKYPDGKSKLVVIANYRPPVDKFILEFPAGLTDAGESIEKVAARELKEETGYIMSNLRTDIPMIPIFDDPWKSNEATKVLMAEIDMTNPENLAPKQDLDKGEMIRVHTIDIGPEGLDQIKKLAEANDYGICNFLWMFFMGLCYKF